MIAYVLFRYNMIIGGAVFGRWATGVAKRTRALPDGPFPLDLASVLTDRRIQALTWIDLGVIIAIVFDMVVKPFS